VAPASAAPEGNTIVEIKSAVEGLCVESGTTYPTLAACTGSTAQQFERIQTGTGSYLRNIGDGQCLDGYYSSVEEKRCDPDRSGQRFQEVPDTDGAVRLSATGHDGTAFLDSWLYPLYREVGMAPDLTRETQRWFVREVGTVPPPQLATVIKIRHAEQDTCLSDSKTATNELKPCDLASGFERIDAGNGLFALRNQTNGRCLTVYAGEYVWMQTCNITSAAQQWKLSDDALGNYTVSNGDRVLTPRRDNKSVMALTFMGIGLWQHWQLPAA
ncbi:MAG TPA: RICIN domain-containing protein, partial [Lentzea sp.]